jgi:hypothetical protein
MNRLAVGQLSTCQFHAFSDVRFFLCGLAPLRYTFLFFVNVVPFMAGIL